jgi:DNA mismatch endonuclease, patch repair protein
MTCDSLSSWSARSRAKASCAYTLKVASEPESPTATSVRGRPTFRSAPEASSADALRRMRRQRRRDTAPELALRRELHRRGLRYRVDHTVLAQGRRRHDIVFPGARLVVEVRGCFWHCCELHGSSPKSNSAWWSEKLERNVARDNETEALLARAGWRIIVVWEHEDPMEAADRVEAAAAVRP